jgi:hypothetical protein
MADPEADQADERIFAMKLKACAALVIIACLTACGASAAPSSPAMSPTAVARASASPKSTPVPVSQGNAVVYLHYYIWWTAHHWRDKLGPDYPVGASPLPLPGVIGSDGCNPHPTYRSATIVDVPSEGLYDQNAPTSYDAHISLASDAGVRGFLVDWIGTGAPSQTPSSADENARLDKLVSRVDAFNASSKRPFGLGLAFAARGNFQRPAADIIADLRYFAAQYGHDSAFRNEFSSKPIVMWMDSRKYPQATVQQVSASVESDLYLLGDETANSWSRDSSYLDGSSYYWSTENPYSNTSAGKSLQSLGTQIHSAQKKWFAPFIAGYNKQLAGGGCVPRLGTKTLQNIWQLNSQSKPDGWFGISWNEFVENTYLEPSQALSTSYLDALKHLIAGS